MIETRTSSKFNKTDCSDPQKHHNCIINTHIPRLQSKYHSPRNCKKRWEEYFNMESPVWFWALGFALNDCLYPFKYVRCQLGNDLKSLHVLYNLCQRHPQLRKLQLTRNKVCRQSMRNWYLMWNQIWQSNSQLAIWINLDPIQI